MLVPQIIHRQSDYDRLPRLFNELQTQGIVRFDFWEGVYDVMSVKRGINLAHKQIVLNAKQRNLEEVLIFEDDIRFCGNGAFDEYLRNKPVQYDIYLGGIYLGEIDQFNKVKSFSGLHCYCVHNRFFDKFLSMPDDEHLDRILENKGEYYVSYPFTSIQYNGVSSNTRKEENYDHLLNGRLLYNNFQL
jgi:hypothetical protein